MGDQETIDDLMSAVAERDVTILELQGTIDEIKEIVNEFVPGVSAAEILSRIKNTIDPENDADGIDEEFDEDDGADFW